MPQVTTRRQGDILIVTIDRPEVLNAVDRPTAEALYEAFIAFAEDDTLAVAVLTGSGGTFCAGADLKAMADAVSSGKLADGTASRTNRLYTDMDAPGPMGPTRLDLPKPVIAAIEGHCVAGGLELACWADLRVASSDSQYGVLCRRRGVPLIDGGTVRLPALIGLSRASDLILTGRLIDAQEAHAMGLVNVLVPAGASTLDTAIALAQSIASHPRLCMLNDRQSAREATLGAASVREARWSVSGRERAAMAREFALGLDSLTAMGAEVIAFAQRGKSKL